MASLGTTQHPAIVRVQTPERASAVMFGCKERGWHVIVGVESDKPEDLTDIEVLLRGEHPLPKIGRNDPCPCGSGRKFKKCCISAPSPAQRLVADSTLGLPASAGGT